MAMSVGMDRGRYATGGCGKSVSTKCAALLSPVYARCECDPLAPYPLASFWNIQPFGRVWAHMLVRRRGSLSEVKTI
jgi:hypothetical protein